MTTEATRADRAAGERRRLSRTEARQRTRQLLLEAAAEEFKRSGYHGASLEAVAEAAGFTKGAVYSNFKTKADLFIALLESWVDGESAAQEAEYGHRPLEAFIDDLDRVFRRQVQDDPTWVVLQIEFWLAAVRDPVIRARVIEATDGLREASAASLDLKLADAGIRSPFTGAELGLLINALATGLAIDWEIDPSSVDPKLLVRATRLLVGLDPDPQRDTIE